MALRSAALRSAPALTPSRAAALAESPISAELAAPSERPGLGARRVLGIWHTGTGLVAKRTTRDKGEQRAMATEPVTLELDEAAARVFKEASPEQRRSLEALVSLHLLEAATSRQSLRE